MGSDTLTADERLRLTELEPVVERGLRSYIDAGRALREIRDSRLYRVEFSSFPPYLRQRFNLSIAHATHMIEAAQIAEALSRETVEPPATEAQARQLLPIRDDPTAMAEVLTDLRERHGEKLTAPLVRAAVEDRLAQREPPVELDETTSESIRPSLAQLLLARGMSSVRSNLLVVKPADLTRLSDDDRERVLRFVDELMTWSNQVRRELGKTTLEVVS
jgi:hypothetical protein